MKLIWLILAFMILIAILIPTTGGQQTVREWTVKGNDLLEHGKYNDAILAYENATELNTGNTTDELANAWYELGKEFLHRDLNDYASRCYEKAISLAPNRFHQCDYGFSSKLGGDFEIWQGVSKPCINAYYENGNVTETIDAVDSAEAAEEVKA